MKNRKNRLHQFFSAVLGSSLVLSAVSLPAAAAGRQLVNRAADFAIEVPSYENDSKGPDKLVDGDVSSLWVAADGTWPSVITFNSPVDSPIIYKAVFRFEQGFPQRSVDVQISHVVNNVVSDPVIDRTEDDFSFGDELAVSWEEGISPTSLSISLSDPKLSGAAGQFWPGLAEVEIYTEKQSDPEPSQLVNVAVRGTVSANMVRDTPGNLIDENYSSLYVFSTGMSGTPDPWVQVSLEKETEVSEIEVAFEKQDPDPSAFVFTYDILAKPAAGSSLSTDADGWAVLASDQSASRVDNIQTLKLEKPAKLTDVRIRMTKITNTGGDPWPALAELKIFAKEDAQPVETDNILSGKSIHTNYGQNIVDRIVDGSLNTVWEGEVYPAYVDFDLGENYALEEAIVYTPASGYSQYSIYTSMDGRNFDRVARKTSEDACTSEGETWQLENTEARFVRLYTEYNSSSAKSQVREFVVHGEKTGTPIVTAAPVQVEDFADSIYSAPVTEQDTIREVQGIISRRLDEQYVDWFTFELADQANGYDWYEVSAKEGKIHIRGNNGVSLATGLNAWLKEYAKVNISQVSDQVKMPDEILLPDSPLRKETRFPVRYSYNFCTLSYSMAFWGEEEWRNELDWLALNGVNVVLDATGEEEVWRRFLSECGYTHQEIKDFIAGPAYYAWFYMDNLSGMGGPLPDDWFEQRTELARKNHRIMQSLGMEPVLQGYCGMVPTDFQSKQPEAKVIAQPKWCSFQRPYMLKTDDAATFDKYAAMFYKHQQAVYGDVTHYYATDPFHEGGATGGMNVSTIASQTLKAMMASDEDAVWIIQSWQGNPSDALLNGLEGNREHALILDLYAERQPHWNATSGYGEGEFADTPWVYCMLNNFGGRLGLHGHLDNLNTKIPAAASQASHMAGIGITPEGSQNNPLLYDYIFDTIWQEDASENLQPLDLESWLDEYALRRYGNSSPSARAALEILKNTVYDSAHNQGPNEGGQGAPENVVNARPSLTINAASTWGFSNIKYEKNELEKALKLLLEDYDLLKDSAGYRYDLVNVAQQVLSNTAQEYLAKMNESFSAGSLEEFTEWSDQFLTLIDASDELLSTQKHFLLGNWTEAAGRMIEDPDDFTADLFDLNAKALVSTWGSITQSNAGGLHDYSNRQWAGLTADLYKPRWEKFIDAKKKELSGQGGTNYTPADWFEMEWAWARNSSKEYGDVPSDKNIQALAQNVLTSFSVKSLNPEADDSRDLDREKMSAAARSEEPLSSSNTAEGPARFALDNDTSSWWHSLWAGDTRENLWLELTLDSPALVDGLRYLPRSGASNGTITSYSIEVQAEGSQEWSTVSTGSWTRSDGWKMASFPPVSAKKVRLYAVESYSNNSANFASAAEVRLTGVWEDAPKVDLYTDLLEAVLEDAGSCRLDDFISNESLNRLKSAIEAGVAVFKAPKTQKEIDDAASAVHDAWLNVRLIPDVSALEKLN